MIEYLAEEHCDCLYPAVVCDYCGKRIERAEHGLYFYQNGEQGPVPGTLRFAHHASVSGSDCHALYVEKHQWPHGGTARNPTPWNTLECFTLYLGRNLGMDLRLFVNDTETDR